MDVLVPLKEIIHTSNKVCHGDQMLDCEKRLLLSYCALGGCAGMYNKDLDSREDENYH